MRRADEGFLSPSRDLETASRAIGDSKAVSSLYNLCQDAISRKRRTSVLVFGPAGSGKSWVVEMVKVKLAKEHNFEVVMIDLKQPRGKIREEAKNLNQMLAKRCSCLVILTGLSAQTIRGWKYSEINDLVFEVVRQRPYPEAEGWLVILGIVDNPSLVKPDLVNGFHNFLYVPYMNVQLLQQCLKSLGVKNVQKVVEILVLVWGGSYPSLPTLIQSIASLGTEILHSPNPEEIAGALLDKVPDSSLRVNFPYLRKFESDNSRLLSQSIDSEFDVLVAGGGISGLVYASEAARIGIKILVAEKQGEVGESTKCDGLVSLRGLRTYGYIPADAVIQKRIASAYVHLPWKRQFYVDVRAMEIAVIDRSAFVKQLADLAVSRGVTVRKGAEVTGVEQDSEGVVAKVGGSMVHAKYFIDATGLNSDLRKKTIPATIYELEGDWTDKSAIEVYIDASRFPSFFEWKMPSGGRKVRIGVAGVAAEPTLAIEERLEGRYKVLRKVSTSLYLGGPVSKFVSGRKLLIGEAAGQVKPTTGGGIMLSIAGAVMAAKATAAAIKQNDPHALEIYQTEWESRFLKEMNAMLRLRGVYEKLTNKDLETIFDILATPRFVKRLSQIDFDFHATGVLQALGISGLLRVARAIALFESLTVLNESRVPP